MSNFENGTNLNINTELDRLKAIEESSRRAAEEAMKPISEGGATPAVQEVLQGAYYSAKQAREEFEANS